MTYDPNTHKEELAALRKYAAMQRANEDKITVPKIYMDITDDLPAALVLDEVIFWTLPGQDGKSRLRRWKDGYLWLAVTRDEWWNRRRLTPRQADRAIDKLEQAELIVKKVHNWKGHGTTHLRLNVPEFFKRYEEILASTLREIEETPIEDMPEDEQIEELRDVAQPEQDLSSFGPVSPDGNQDTVQYHQTVIGNSPNGETHNSPHYSPNYILQPAAVRDVSDGSDPATEGAARGGKTPPAIWGPEWQVAAGKPITQEVQDAETERRRRDVALVIATGTKDPVRGAQLVMAFQKEKNFTISKTDRPIKTNRAALNEILEYPVRPEHVALAYKTLNDQRKADGVIDLHGVKKLAIGFSTKKTETTGVTRKAVQF